MVGPSKPSIHQVTHHYAGVIIFTASGRVVGQLRDNKPGIDQPGKIGLFGGTIEEGEDPLKAAYRELIQEETNLQLALQDFTVFSETVEWRPLTQEWEGYHIFTVGISDEQLDSMEVYEGQGWAEITDPNDENVVEPLRPILAKFIAARPQ